MSARKTRLEHEGGTATAGAKKHIVIPEDVHLEIRRITLERRGATIQDVVEELLRWAIEREKAKPKTSRKSPPKK